MQTVKTKRTLLILAIIFFWFSQYVYGPYQTPYLLGLGAAAAFVGVIGGAYGFTQMLLRIPVGIFADLRNRHKGFILVGILCSALASVIRAFCPYPVAFLFAQMLSGVASAMWISFSILYASLFLEGELKKSMGYIVAGNNGGILLGFTAGTLLNHFVSLQSVFISSIAAGLVSLAFAAFIREGKPAGGIPAEKRTFKDLHLGQAFKSKKLIFYCILAFLMQMVIMSTALNFTMAYAKGITTEEFTLGICSMIFMAVSVATSFFISRLKWSNTTIISVLFACLLVYCALVPLSGAMWQLYILQAVVGMGNGGLFSLLMAYAMTGVQKEHKSTVMGFYQASYSVGMTLGPVILGALANNGSYTAGFWVIGGFALAGIVITQTARRMPLLKSRKTEAPEAPAAVQEENA